MLEPKKARHSSGLISWFKIFNEIKFH